MKRKTKSEGPRGVIFELGILGASFQQGDHVITWRIALFGKYIGPCIHCNDTTVGGVRNYGLFCKDSRGFETKPIAICSNCYSHKTFRETAGKAFASGQFCGIEMEEAA